VKTERPPALLAERYRLQTLLERTRVGAVWLALDTVLDRAVTVTLVDHRIAEDPAARDLLFANARALATASPPNLVEPLDAGMDEDVPFLVTERKSGETLEERLQRDGPLAAGIAAGIVADVLDALAGAHAAGVVHGDLTPADVIVDDRGHVRVRNAGIAAAAAAAGVPGGRTAPEGGDVDQRSDVWQAGALLVELLTARPYAATDDVTRLRAPRSVRAVVERALSDDPSERIPDATSMAAALRDAVRPERRSVRSLPRIARTWLAVPVLVTVVAAAVVAGGLWLGRLEIGGPLGITTDDQAPTTVPAAAEPVRIASVRVLDPSPGDGQENDDARWFVDDGDLATAWTSENYFDGVLGKPGVGVLLDLGRSITVSGFRLDTPVPGFRFSVVVGDDVHTMLADARSAPSYTAPDANRTFGPSTGRYALVWITSVVPVGDGSNRAEVSEIRIFGAA
jgi:Protein kinase domain